MFSGKSKALLERGLRASEYGGIDVYYFKPALDTRDIEIVSRNGMAKTATLVEKGIEIYEQMLDVPTESVVIIDEAQFFDESLVYAVQLLKIRGHNIVVAGLDKDFRGQSFGFMPQLMALCDTHIQKVYPVCSIEGCFEDGTLPQRTRNGEPDSALSPTVVIEGSSDEISYAPVCSSHHRVPDLEEYIKNQMLEKEIITS